MRILILLLAGMASYAQTQIGSRTAAVGSSMDFSAASTALGRTTGEIVPTWPSFTGIWDGYRLNVNSYPVTQQFGFNATPLPEALVGLINIPSNSAGSSHGTGVAGYSQTVSTTVASLGVYGSGTCAAGLTQCFGGNFIVQHNGSIGGSNMVGIESDVNHSNSGAARAAIIKGITSVANLITQPSGFANAYEAIRASTSNFGFDAAFFSNDGAAGNALVAGQGTAGSVVTQSQNLLFYSNNGGTRFQSQIFEDSSGNLIIRPASVGTIVFDPLNNGSNPVQILNNGSLKLTSLAGGGALHAACVDNVGLLQNGSCGGGTSQVCVLTRTSATVLTLAAGATSTNPCILNGTTFISPITFTVSANGGTIYIYASLTSIIGGYGGGTFGSGNVTCSSCTATFGITAFPNPTDGVVPIWKWTATAGTWDVSGGTKELQEAGSQNFIQGTNITLTKTPTGVTIDAASGASSFKTVTIPVSSAEIKTLNSVGKLLVTGVASKFIQVLAVTATLAVGATAYTSGGNLKLSIGGAVQPIDNNDLTQAWMQDASGAGVFKSASIWATQGASYIGTTGSFFAGQDLRLSCATADFATGNGTMVVTVAYVEMSTI